MVRPLFLATLVLLFLLVPAGVLAEVVFTPVMGEFAFDVLEVSCPQSPSGCTTCYNDANTTGDNRLIVALGATQPNVVTTGEAAGVVRPFVVVDGVRLTPDLFPCGATFRSGIRWSDLPLARSCGDTPKQATYQIGSMPEETVSGDGSIWIEFPAEGAEEVPFRLTVCGQFIYWGAGCNVGESSSRSWELRIPAAMHARSVPPGATDLLDVPGSAFGVEFSGGPGGRLMVSRGAEDPPETPPVPHLNGYWDLRSDMAPGSFQAKVTLDVGTLPPGVDPQAVQIAAYRDQTQSWEPLATVVEGSKAQADVDRFTKLVLVESVVVPVKQTSWGELKKRPDGIGPDTRP